MTTTPTRRYLLSMLLLVGTSSFSPRVTVVTRVNDCKFTRSVEVDAKSRSKPELDENGLPVGQIRAPRPKRSDVKSKWGGTEPKRRSNQGKALEAGMTSPSRLRVMGGVARGRRLDSPQVQLRPMMGKVKEALYSTLTGFGCFDERFQGASNGIRHLDLFSGSGSVGIESLSRGASHVTFVDFSKDCCEVSEKNVLWCGFNWEGAGTSVCASVGDVLLNPPHYALTQPFDIVTVTPPYEEVSYAELVRQLASTPLVVEDTIVVIEYPVELGTLPPVLGGPPENGGEVEGTLTVHGQNGQRLIGVRNRRYGRTVIGVYVCSPTGKWNLDVRSEEFLSAHK